VEIMDFEILTEKINFIQFLYLMKDNNTINITANIKIKSKKISDTRFNIYITYTVKSTEAPFRLDWDILVEIKFNLPIKNFDEYKILTDFNVLIELDELISKLGYPILKTNLPSFSDLYRKQNYDKGD
jgi:hypothetical protein